MSSYRLRPTTQTDAVAVAQLICDLGTVVLGHPDYSLEELESEWRTMDIGADTWVAVTGSRPRPVAYATIELRADHAVADACVDPAHHGRGVGAMLVEHLEDEARRRGAARVRNAVLALDGLGVGWVSRLFTVRQRRGEGIGGALLADAFGRFWERGQRTVGLGVDAHSQTGANRLYERAGMHVHWSAVVFEKELA